MTVAVIDAAKSQGVVAIPETDLKIEWYSGTGAGGQHRNKHQNSCRITHIPTGTVATAQCRSRQNSFAEALQTIQIHISNLHKKQQMQAVALDRRQQVGAGMRGDKIRTYRFQDDVVADHITGKKSSVKRIMNGELDLLW